MIWVIVLIFAILGGIGLIKDEEWIFAPSIGICVVALIVGFLAAWDLIDGRVLDDRIAMYETENAAIEQEITTLVEQYMVFESDTYSELKGDSAVTLISLYPELKSNELVSKQCELYIANKEQIVRLKEEKLDLSTAKFLIYFGK